MNTRFTKRGNLDYATLDALIKFYEKGGTITKAETPKRPKRGYTVGKQSKVVKE